MKTDTKISFNKFKVESTNREEILDSELQARRLFSKERKEVLSNEEGKSVLSGSNDGKNWEVISQTEFKTSDSE